MEPRNFFIRRIRANLLTFYYPTLSSEIRECLSLVRVRERKLTRLAIAETSIRILGLTRRCQSKLAVDLTSDLNAF